MIAPIAASSKPEPKGFTSWSFSRFNSYAKCPLAAKLSLIDKLPQAESAAMSRGDSIHKQAAAYISKQTRKLPDSLTLFKDLIGDLRSRYGDDVTVEDTWAFRDDWSVTTWDDWEGCWLRIKTDAVRLAGSHMDVMDWKTGKYSPQYNVAEYTLQMDLYSLGALLMYGAAVPDLTVSPHLVYLDHGIVHPEKAHIYRMNDLPRLKQDWTKRTKPMLSDRTFAPNPGMQCRWCSFSKEKNGPCQF
jgi:RecB family exonuclease